MNTTTRRLAALTMAAGLGTAIVAGSAVASADTATPKPPVHSTQANIQKKHSVTADQVVANIK